MHFTKKLICLLLCIAALALPLLSCDKDPAESSSGAVAASGADSKRARGPTVYVADVPVVDLDGRVFRVLCRDYSYGSTSVTGFNGEGHPAPRL